MLKNVKVYVSEVHNPAFNLALESYLLRCNTPETMIFYLWQNDKTIVIGRHQNPYRECNLKKVMEDNVTVIRRPSGGGAVYHDLGNLNFTFIAGEGVYDVPRQCGVIVEALKCYSLNCEVSGRNDMTIEGAKFSGHAYMNHDDMQCHHGTLLVDSNLKKLSDYLTVSDVKLKSKGIESVRSRVANLSEIYGKLCNSEMRVADLKENLIQQFLIEYPYESTFEVVGYENAGPEVLEDMKRFDTWDWNIAESLEFDITYEAKFDWGIMEIRFNCLDGRITGCDLSSDCLLDERFELLKESFIGTAFEKDQMVQILRNTLIQDVVRKDLIVWFDTLLLDHGSPGI